MCKPGQNKEGYRGELELKLGFTVKATENNAGGGSVADLRRGTKGSLTSLNKVAGADVDADVVADVIVVADDADADATSADAITYLPQQGGWHPGGVFAQPGRQGEEEHQEAGQVGGEEGGEGWGEGKADGGGR